MQATDKARKIVVEAAFRRVIKPIEWLQEEKLIKLIPVRLPEWSLFNFGIDKKERDEVE